MQELKTLVRATEDTPKVVGTAGMGSDTEVTVTTMPWYKMAAIRAARVYLQALVGFLVVGGTGIGEAAGIPIYQFGGNLATAATLAVAPSVVSLLQNILEFLTKLDVTNPALRA